MSSTESTSVLNVPNVSISPKSALLSKMSLQELGSTSTKSSSISKVGSEIPTSGQSFSGKWGDFVDEPQETGVNLIPFSIPTLKTSVWGGSVPASIIGNSSKVGSEIPTASQSFSKNNCTPQNNCNDSRRGRGGRRVGSFRDTSRSSVGQNGKQSFHPFQRLLRQPAKSSGSQPQDTKSGENGTETKSLVSNTSVLKGGIHDQSELSNIEQNVGNEDVLSDDKYVTQDVRLADSEGDLKLYHYVHCDDESDDIVKSSRGIIRQGDNIVCKTFGYTSEILSSDKLKCQQAITMFNQCKVYNAEEGATVRVFFYNNKWNLSTHRKIDAYHSRWGSPTSKSFGDMFVDAIEWEATNGSLKGVLHYENKDDIFIQYCATLDPLKSYTFLVRNSKDNRIVCDPPSHPQVYFIGSFDRSTHLLTEGNDSGVNMPQSWFFDTVDQMLNFVDNNIDHTQVQGLIVYMPNQTQVKIMNPLYVSYFNARGNEPSIKFRYLQVRNDKDQVSMLYNLYPDYISIFEKYENVLSDLGRKIYRAYVNRFINRQYVSLPQSEYFVMQSCHTWHTQDRIRNKISPDKVLELIYSQTPTSLNRMIKPYVSKNGSKVDVNATSSASSTSQNTVSQPLTLVKSVLSASAIPFVPNTTSENTTSEKHVQEDNTSS